MTSGCHSLPAVPVDSGGALDPPSTYSVELSPLMPSPSGSRALDTPDGRADAPRSPAGSVGSPDAGWPVGRAALLVYESQSISDDADAEAGPPLGEAEVAF